MTYFMMWTITSIKAKHCSFLLVMVWWAFLMMIWLWLMFVTLLLLLFRNISIRYDAFSPLKLYNNHMNYM